jgi:uncharacterized membrane protein YidH (DUF202 family)
VSAPPSPDAPRPRLADERTDLSWNRSGLALIACGVVIARGFTLQQLPRADVVVGAVILGLGMMSYFLAGWHAHRRFSGERVHLPAQPSDLWPLAFGVGTIGVAAFALGLFFPS